MLPQELTSNNTHIIPQAIYCTNLKGLEMFLYIRMWDDCRYYTEKYGFYAPSRERLAAYLNLDSPDGATDVRDRIFAKGYGRLTGKKHNYKPVIEIYDYREIEGTIIFPSLENRVSQTKELKQKKAPKRKLKLNGDTPFSETKDKADDLPLNGDTPFNNDEEKAQMEKAGSLNGDTPFTKRVKSRHTEYNTECNTEYNSSTINNINDDSQEELEEGSNDTEIESNFSVTSHKQELGEDSKCSSSPLSDNEQTPVCEVDKSSPLLASSQLADSPVQLAPVKITIPKWAEGLTDFPAFLAWERLHIKTLNGKDWLEKKAIYLRQTESQNS